MMPPNEIIELLRKDQAVRTYTCRKSHLLFFLTYLNSAIEYPFADFQLELFALTQSTGEPNLVIMGFRNCAKSTILTYSYPIWAIVGEQQKRFIVIASQTRAQASAHFHNIKRELETNELLRQDLGPFETSEDLWGSFVITIAKYKAKIMVTSVDQSIRGIRYLNRRPDLIILDDVEDSRSVRTKEGREKTFDWLTREIIPMGDRHTRVVVVGNLLHEDSLLLRLKTGIKEKTFSGIFRAYPLLDGEGTCLWPGKYPSAIEIEAQKLKAGSVRAWKQEYLLILVQSDDQIILREWIKYSNAIPSLESKNYLGTILAIDPASSLSEHADYTAMVAVRVFQMEHERHLYVHRRIVNKRLTPHATEGEVLSVVQAIGSPHNIKVIVEGNSYQVALAEALHMRGLHTEVVHSRFSKEERLITASGPVEAGNVFFPTSGVDELVDQLVNFGTQKHDDLADAFAMAIQGAMLLEYATEPSIDFV